MAIYFTRSVGAEMRASWEYLSKLARGTANLIVFIGPDGSGKSTLSKAIASRWSAAIWMPMQRGQDWWREVNGRFLDLNLRLRGEMARRPAGPKRKVVSATTYTLEYIEQHVRLARMLGYSGGRPLLTDSYAWGPVIRWEAKASPVPFWWTARCSALFPIPRLTVLCGGDPEAIWRRKPDMDPRTIERTIRLYRAYLRGRGLNYMELDTTAESTEASTQRMIGVLDAIFPAGAGSGEQVVPRTEPPQGSGFGAS